ncbi:peroxidase E5-like [Vicia villosa]|uniref:peroxidase E5-like n=1 Tax=Vicia villosa TaxID=3911 RepID=UPI00273C86E1|nr:peroxidase E5-like [Vicia villosa]
MTPLGLIATALCCIAIMFGGLTFPSNAQHTYQFSRQTCPGSQCIVSNAQLDPFFYSQTCPQLQSIVNQILVNVATKDPRMPASLIRLHFHDCFVQGCDASVLLNTTSNFESEQEAFPNTKSLRGLDVINQIKTAVESACPNIVSCADILALSAELSSVLAGGPGWSIPLGRRDSLTANKALANDNLPGPSSSLTELKSAFAAQGLSALDLTSLLGAHSFGRLRCKFFHSRLYNFHNTGKPDPAIDPTYLKVLQNQCPPNGRGENLANFDPTSPDNLDNNFYKNLQGKKGLLKSDQELSSTPGEDTTIFVNFFASSQYVFHQNFGASMIKMGNIGVLMGKKGEIRKQCNFVNQQSFVAPVTSTGSFQGGWANSRYV